MEVSIEERDVRAVWFSLDEYNTEVKLLAEAATFLERLQSHGVSWILLGTNYKSDEFGEHLSLFLERVIIPPSRPPTADAAQSRPPPYAVPKEPVIRYL